MKYGVNALETDPNLSMMYFLAYGCFASGMVLCDGKKMEVSTSIALAAWKDSSIKMFEHILKLDANYHF